MTNCVVPLMILVNWRSMAFICSLEEDGCGVASSQGEVDRAASRAGRWLVAQAAGRGGSGRAGRSDGLLHGVVDLEDDAFGAVVAVELLLVLALDDGEGVHDVGHGVARGGEAGLEPRQVFGRLAFRRTPVALGSAGR